MILETAGSGWGVVLGFVLGAAATYRWRSAPRAHHRASTDIAMPMKIALLEQAKHAWEQFASHAIPLIPVLTRQLATVIEQTERAALDLSVNIRSISERAQKQAAEMGRIATSVGSSDHARVCADGLAADVSRIVMAMQFQDITKQKLEHVRQPLTQMKTYMESLLADPTSPKIANALNLLEEVERSYTMEAERTAMAHALNGRAHPDATARSTSEEEDDSVTLFQRP